jgi:hypothetical protein
MAKVKERITPPSKKDGSAARKEMKRAAVPVEE